MVISDKKRLFEILKIQKKHVIVMFVCMNAANTYLIQHKNDRVHHRRKTSVR